MLSVESSDKHHEHAGFLNKIKIIFALNDGLYNKGDLFSKVFSNPEFYQDA